MSPAEGGPAAVGRRAPRLQTLGFLLGVAHRAERRVWEAEISDLGLTGPQAALLRLVAAEPGSGVRRLARELGTDPMNTQRIAEALIAAQLVEARRDPRDARRKPLHPTELGRALSRAVGCRAEESERRLRQALGEETYACLLRGLMALIDHDERGPGGGGLTRRGVGAEIERVGGGDVTGVASSPTMGRNRS